ncbi:MAG: CcoQ/FixQ family Cbb3-type cytochrome c oxidase assembly chaperone [Ignavibacteriales bacterium]|jgi:L-cystine uptake protein TcyP (sodium:dicarboxylate symporter family)|nr:CcoQ/FixQ family Cbb3-type cytochrome c oxidase assembly chaperone [Ignavibacteriales bacterium]MBP7543277.1 cbb3-type cytochrome c oxidase subunit 3 [Ignavibacteriaceae bacterium]MBK7266936.1 CcoQ/FixQ family Cbb3-type cytochrome c oxidase assembly chaperone [Ignavibacteriales bacterium]MBK8660694.1 CcoQ/FixQ family Cbb3-type cytochrome c oxidase assembly chaperone [Ignavibacteriales bacterium]MBP9121760.1 cbb3-type cytochrome c oxidase subunit 3 [Ignavibacteriaceae bacterium]
MYQNILTSIEGITVFPIISLVIFVLFFSVVIYRVVRIPNEEIKEIEKIPLDD